MVEIHRRYLILCLVGFLVSENFIAVAGSPFFASSGSRSRGAKIGQQIVDSFDQRYELPTSNPPTKPSELESSLQSGFDDSTSSILFEQEDGDSGYDTKDENLFDTEKWFSVEENAPVKPVKTQLSVRDRIKQIEALKGNTESADFKRPIFRPQLPLNVNQSATKASTQSVAVQTNSALNVDNASVAVKDEGGKAGNSRVVKPMGMSVRDKAKLIASKLNLGGSSQQIPISSNLAPKKSTFPKLNQIDEPKSEPEPINSALTHTLTSIPESAQTTSVSVIETGKENQAKQLFRERAELLHQKLFGASEQKTFEPTPAVNVQSTPAPVIDESKTESAEKNAWEDSFANRRALLAGQLQGTPLGKTAEPTPAVNVQSTPAPVIDESKTESAEKNTWEDSFVNRLALLDAQLYGTQLGKVAKPKSAVEVQSPPAPMTDESKAEAAEKNAWEESIETRRAILKEKLFGVSKATAFTP